MKNDMDQYNPDNELIIRYIKELKLPTVKDSLDDIEADALAQKWDYRKFLRTLLQREVEQRFENRKYVRIKRANFPQLKYLQELVREDLPAEGRNLLPEAETLNFIREGRNIVMYGNPGTGKTHIAIGLGIKACMEGYNVYFTTVPHLLTQIREAKTNKTMQLLETRFKRFDLVICDEMGYVSFDKEGAELLFNMISTRTGERATIITTNLPFTRWEEIIKDKVLCSALVDRLCHRARLVNMTGQSYRVRETQKMLKNLE
jgi:DNA replication protein DnaC